MKLESPAAMKGERECENEGRSTADWIYGIEVNTPNSIYLLIGTEAIRNILGFPLRTKE
jgi:hypothetical protein